MEGPKGTLVILNGTSSSGKTSIAGQLEKMLGPNYQTYSCDTFGKIWMAKHAERLSDFKRRIAKLGEDNKSVIQDYKGLSLEFIIDFTDELVRRAETGQSYIVDHVIWQPTWGQICAENLAPYNIVLVGVHCPVEILEQREIDRGDRTKGTARTQFPLVHVRKIYDVEVDSSQLSPQKCASTIATYIKNREPSNEVTTSQKFYNT